MTTDPWADDRDVQKHAAHDRHEALPLPGETRREWKRRRKDGRPNILPQPLALDPEPFVSHHGRHDEADPAGWDFDVQFTFKPRPGYSQNPEDYA